MSSLYDIAREIEDVIEKVENGELEEQYLNDTIESLNFCLEDKLEYLAKLIKNKTALIEDCRKEKELLDKKIKTADNSITSIKNYITYCLDHIGKTKVQAGAYAVSIAKNGGQVPINITVSEDKVPEDYIKVVKTAIDKDKIRKELENGKILDFAEYGEVGRHVNIK